MKKALDLKTEPLPAEYSASPLIATRTTNLRLQEVAPKDSLPPFSTSLHNLARGGQVLIWDEDEHENSFYIDAKGSTLFNMNAEPVLYVTKRKMLFSNSWKIRKMDSTVIATIRKKSKTQYDVFVGKSLHGGIGTILLTTTDNEQGDIFFNTHSGATVAAYVRAPLISASVETSERDLVATPWLADAMVNVSQSTPGGLSVLSKAWKLAIKHRVLRAAPGCDIALLVMCCQVINHYLA